MPDIQCILQDLRSKANNFEQKLNSEARKQRGQYFTSPVVAKLLAGLSFLPTYHNVLDPMAGGGNLLDAIAERAALRDCHLNHIDGIEIDEQISAFCSERIKTYKTIFNHKQSHVLTGDFFDLVVLEKLPVKKYDLVITNPPYIRYQTLSNRRAENNIANTEEIRSQLLSILDRYAPEKERFIWETLIRSYSGLSDLAVPAWILCALLVSPGGTLAMVAPATWSSRDYAQIIQYLLLRCFGNIIIIEDTGTGWFPDALVRTTLIIARRLPSQKTILPLSLRNQDEIVTKLISIPGQAQNKTSLVGRAFKGKDPENEFISWLSNEKRKKESEMDQLKANEIRVNEKSLSDARTALVVRADNASWLMNLEPDQTNIKTSATYIEAIIPNAIKDCLPKGIPINLKRIKDLPIKVGQGLRTGCNAFFYVTIIDKSSANFIRVETSRGLGSMVVSVPADAVRPVLRKQSEAQDSVININHLNGRVLNLRNWVLPEDFSLVQKKQAAYAYQHQHMPEKMPEDLSLLVRTAATVKVGNKSIPELSAVKTNIRRPKPKETLVVPRFWYMLPEFTRRHLPDVLISRIIHRSPRAILNTNPPVLIDANFSTLWATDPRWTSYTLYAVLNSAWSRACMEAIGTPLGGGALKLEATHIRNIPLPHLNIESLNQLDLLGKRLIEDHAAVTTIDDLVLSAIFSDHNLSSSKRQKLNKELYRRIDFLSEFRQRKSYAKNN